MNIKLTPNTTIEYKARKAVATIDVDEVRGGDKLWDEKAKVARWADRKGLDKVTIIERTAWRHHTNWEEYRIPVNVYL